jgi:hypothetical protein
MRISEIGCLEKIRNQNIEEKRQNPEAANEAATPEFQTAFIDFECFLTSEYWILE